MPFIFRFIDKIHVKNYDYDSGYIINRADVIFFIP
jgi:hypothetical protein